MARFCSSCGQSVGGTPAPSSPPVSSQATSPPFSPVVSTPPVASSPSALISFAGYPQPAFNILAGAIFHALDQNVQPSRTGGLEVSKMITYRSMGGATIPPYYGEHVIPTYASVIGIELVPNQPRSAPVVSWNGWHQFLLHKIKLEPEASFFHISRLIAAFGISIILNRADFPLAPDPMALVKETQFKSQIYSLARIGLGASAIGIGSSGNVGGAGGFNLGNTASKPTGSSQGVESAVAIGKLGLNILSATMGASMGTNLGNGAGWTGSS